MRKKILKYLDRKNNRLLYFKKNIGPHYWDNHWLKFWYTNKNLIYKASPKSIVCRVTKKFLTPIDGLILEGGCGLGLRVQSLSLMTYNVIGIDFAEKTIRIAKKNMPHLNIKVGDVQNLHFPDNYFVGYWSIGVIEHFFNGFLKTLDEMRRVIKPKGFLFISFPYMSPFRILKARFNLYKTLNLNLITRSQTFSKNFSHYIFNKKNVIWRFENVGFKLIYSEKKSGLKGFKDEIFFLKFFFYRFLNLLIKSENKLLSWLKAILDKLLSFFFGHSILLVFKKSKEIIKK